MLSHNHQRVSIRLALTYAFLGSKLAQAAWGGFSSNTVTGDAGCWKPLPRGTEQAWKYCFRSYYFYLRVRMSFALWFLRIHLTFFERKYDEVIQDENINPMSILPGADNYALRNSSVCGPLHLVGLVSLSSRACRIWDWCSAQADHFTMVVDPVSIWISWNSEARLNYFLDRLHMGSPSWRLQQTLVQCLISQFNKLYCRSGGFVRHCHILSHSSIPYSYFIEDQPLNLTALPNLIKSGAVASINVVIADSMAKKEPVLKHCVIFLNVISISGLSLYFYRYVCDEAGDAPQNQCSSSWYTTLLYRR
jgi:hypothetical protein